MAHGTHRVYCVHNLMGLLQVGKWHRQWQCAAAIGPIRYQPRFQTARSYYPGP